MAPVVRRAGSKITELAHVIDVPCDNLDIVENCGEFIRLWFTIPQVDVATQKMAPVDNVVAKLLLPASRRVEIARMLLSDFPVEVVGANVTLIPRG